MPKRLAHNDHITNGIIEDLKVEYFDVMKKALINFALSDGVSSVQIKKRDKESYKSKMVYQENRVKLFKSLYPINKCLSLINDLWHTNFASTNFIKVDALLAEGSYEIADFVVRID